MTGSQAPAYFPTFDDVRHFLAEHAGGEPHDYARDKAETLEVARNLGVEAQVAAAIRLSREMDATIDASVARAEKREAEVLMFDRGEPGVPRGRVEPGRAAPSDTYLPGYTVGIVWEGYSAPASLVKGIVAPAELTVLFGQSGHFKSVIAIDLALSAGSGREFHGLRTRRAGVLYCAGEGHGGIRKRMRAWLLDRGFDATSDQPTVYITSAGADLIGRPEQLRATVEHAAAVLGVPIELVVIDTLAANFGAGDENHASDMQLAIAGARRSAPEAAILLVHHTGHGQVERERGSYALVAAADYRLQASYDEISKTLELKWLKVKDDERPEPLLFAWRSIPLEWQDAEGEELTSVVLDRLDGPAPAREPRLAGLGKHQETALKSLRTLLAMCRKNLAERGDDPASACILAVRWKADLQRHGIPRQRISDLIRDLQERRLIAIDGPHVAPVEVMP